MSGDKSWEIVRSFMAIYMLIKTQFELLLREGEKDFPWKRFDCFASTDDSHDQEACKYWCNRLLKLTTSSQASHKEPIDQEGDRADNWYGSSGASEIHSCCVWWPVIALLRVTPVLQNGDSTGCEENGADKVQERGHFPWNAENQN